MDAAKPEADVAHGLLVRCPTCHEWLEATDLVRVEGAAESSTADRCPRDGTVLTPPRPRDPPFPPLTRKEKAVGALVIGYAFFAVAWVWVALPLLAGAAIGLIFFGNAALLIAWAVLSVLWLVLVNVLGPVNN